MIIKEYYTVKEIAELLNVSKTTIQNAIKENNIDYDVKEKNRYLYKREKAKEIILFVNPLFDFSIFGNQSTNNDNQTPINENQSKSENAKTPTDDNQSTNNDNQSSSPLEQQVVEQLKKTISIFEAELKEKNRQIQLKDKQIETLNETIKGLNNTLQGQLYINAKEKKLLEAESSDIIDNENKETPKEEKQNKKGFLKRFFGKSN